MIHSRQLQQWSAARLAAASFSGTPLVFHEIWENELWPDPPAVRPLPRNGRLSASFRLPAWGTQPFVSLCLHGYPGTCLEKNFDQPYSDFQSIFIHFRIRINRQTVQDGPLFIRNHGHCGFGQKTVLTIPWPDGLFREGVNELTIENRSPAASFHGMDAYYLISAELTPSSGKLIDRCYRPDALDRWLDAQAPADDLKCGAGYELIPNRNVPAMIRAIAEDRIGNYLMLRLDTALNDGCRATADELTRWASLCAERGIYFSVMLFRAKDHAFDLATARRMMRAAGKYFFSINQHELGLMAFGRKAWIEPFLKAPVRDLKEGWELYRHAVKTRNEREMLALGKPVIASESYLASGHNLRSGVDYAVAEIYASGTMPLLSHVRGATRAYGRRMWGVHMPLLWSLGNGPLYPVCEEKVRRQALANKLSYLYGARILYPESGLFHHIPAYVMGSSARWQQQGFREPDDPIQRALRGTFRAISRYHALHRLPDDPRTPFAFLQGQYDTFGGAIRKDLAFHSPGLAPAQADSGWDLLDVFMPAVKIGNSPRTRVRFWFTGAPLGQLDIVPDDTPAGRLSRYRLLVMPGWNTLSAPLYSRLKKFVSDGGTLFLSAAQLRVDVKHTLRPALFRRGRFDDLFGVTLKGLGGEIMTGIGEPGLSGVASPFVFVEQNALYAQPGLDSGRLLPARAWALTITDPAVEVLVREKETREPILIRKKVGRGYAYLLSAWDYPGHPGLMKFVRDVVRSLAERQPQPVRVEADELVQAFDYEDGKQGRRIALLNTDWRRGIRSRKVRIGVGGCFTEWEVFPLQIRLVDVRKNLFVSPRDEDCSARLLRVGRSRLTLRVVGFGRHLVEIAHPGRKLLFPFAADMRLVSATKGRTVVAFELQGPREVVAGWKFTPGRRGSKVSVTGG
jgi:hypothetical protein